MKTCFCLLFICLFINHSHPQSGYYMLRGHNMPLSSINAYDSVYVKNYVELSEKIYASDQDIRSKSISYFYKNVKRVDSTNFVLYHNYFSKYGYMSFDKKKLSKYISDIGQFLTRNYVFQMHFSDCHAFKLLNLIETSIPKKTCNEHDLMDYFITYLWRRTEFENTRIFDAPVHMLLLPSKAKSYYSKYYEYAFNKYMKHCKYHDSDFKYLRLYNLHIQNNKPNYKNTFVKTNSVQYRSLIAEYVHKYPYIINLFLSVSNPDGYKDGYYDIFICTHPKIYKNPDHYIDY